MFKQISSLLKLRIGVIMMLTALAAMVVTPGQALIAPEILVLVGISVLPFFYGLSWLYLAGALSGGGYFIYRNYQMMLDPSARIAMKSFFASLVQLVLLLTGAVLDVCLLG